MIKLPTAPTPPSIVNPRVLVIYSKPKTGKTPCFAQLKDNLILDLEGGTDLVSATKLSIIGLKPPQETPEQQQARWKTEKYYLSEVITTLRQGHPFKFLTLDTVTVFETWLEKEATLMYMGSPIGKNFNRWTTEDQVALQGQVQAGMLKPETKWESVLTLPKGSGYQWLRDAFNKWMGYLQPLAPTLIISGHVKLVSLVKKDGKETDAKDLDLTGKIKQLTTALIADATGYMYRDGKKNFISFVASEDSASGSRVPHLEGRDILISEKLDDGTIKTYWENIFQ